MFVPFAGISCMEHRKGSAALQELRNHHRRRIEPKS